MIRNRMVQFKNRLFRINDEEPLSKLSLCVIIALDLFILFVVFSGLDDHTRQLTSPIDYVPYECREIVINRNWTQANRLSKLQKMVLSDYHNYSYQYTSRFESSRIQKMHPVCREFFQKIHAVAKDQNILKLFKNRDQRMKKKAQFTSGFKQTKDVYDTSLLEDIAENDEEERNLPPISNSMPSISNSMKDKGRQIEVLNSQILNIEKQLNAEGKIKDLWVCIETNKSIRRDLLVKDLKKFEFRYPLKELFWQLLFLLPLFIVFYFWSIRSVAKNAKLQILISAHLLVISAIPIFFKILETVLELIPRHFFKKFFEILTALHIIAIWHYLVIAGSVGSALIAIYIIQTKIFNKHRLQLKRLAKGLCYRCGKKLPPKAGACPFCGTDQHKNCPSCNQQTFVAGEYCINCGKSIT